MVDHTFLVHRKSRNAYCRGRQTRQVGRDGLGEGCLERGMWYREECLLYRATGKGNPGRVGKEYLARDRMHVVRASRDGE